MPWAPDYLTLAEAKSALRITDTVDDAELPGWITAVSRAIDTSCNRQFGKLAAPATRTYRRPPVWDPVLNMWTVQIDDLMDATGVTVAAGPSGTAALAYASSGALLLPDNAPADGRPWTALGWPDRPLWSYYGSPAYVSMVAPWGWTAVPAVVPAAARLQLARVWARRDSPLGVAGSPSEGSELRLLARLDPDVVTMLRGYRRRRRAG